MEYIIGAIWSALELLCVTFFNGAFLSKKTCKKRNAVVFVAIWGFTNLYTYLPISPFLRQIFLPFIYAGVSLILYNGTYIAHIFYQSSVTYL